MGNTDPARVATMSPDPHPAGKSVDSNLAVRFRRQRNRAAWRRLVEPREVGRLVVANRGVADRTLSCRKERRRSSAHRIQTSAAVERAAQGSGVRSRERGGNAPAGSTTRSPKFEP